MGRISALGLKPKGSTKENLTVKVDSEVLKDIELLEQRIAKNFPDYTFSKADVVQAALIEAVRGVSSALDRQAEKS